MSSPSPSASPSPPASNSTSPPPASNSTSPPPASSPPPPSAPPPTTPPPSSPPPPAATPPSPTPPAATPPSPSPPATTPPSSTPPPATTSPSSSPPPPTTSSPPPPPPTTSSPPPPPLTTSSPPPPASSGSIKSPPPPKSSSHSPPPPPSNSSSSSSSSVSTTAVVGIAIGGVVILVVVGLLCFCCMKKKKRRYGGEQYFATGPPPPPPPRPAPGPKDGQYGQQWQQSNPTPGDQYMMPRPPPPFPPPITSSSTGSEGPIPSPSPGMNLGFSKNQFTYEELAVATEGFSDANILGQGGFGYVHKGVLPNGKEVAVKSLKAGSGQGEREFQAEVEIISRVHHRHLVSLVGYCMAGSERMLVYEFVPNNTLEFHLHGKDRPTMDWSTRLKISLGSAKGLAYLHEDCHPKIIHRDIKASNILLDSKFEAKVADFGLAKFSPDVDTHVSTRVMGTFGYLAPEYASSGKLTDKSDVFSFGVMLLELITGRRPVDSTQTYMDDSLVDWARPLLSRALEEDNFDSLADPRLQKRYNQTEMARMVACAAACVRHSARRRPRMSQVVRALEGDVSLSDLNDGIRPGQSTVYGSYGSSDYDSSQYKEDMKKFRQTALATSSEYGGTTSEYPSGSSSEVRTTREVEMGPRPGATGEFDSGKMKKDS